ncbi:MAG TPA: NAD(P)H-dependent oxidoreductase subunit E [Candidatus Limnocylindria bacterium]|nr:NAD(P)H-dependent oxidoreductase subunit E [Candidatus Limnocylindria bacterium]
MARQNHTSAAPTTDARWELVDARMRQLGNRPDALIEALHTVQETFGYIDRRALERISQTLSVPPSTAFGVATFYHYFNLLPKGEHTAVVCTGTACYIDGAAELLAALETELGVGPKQTTEDGRLTVFTARCIGACSLAPAVIVDGRVHGRERVPDLLERVRAL